MTDIKPDEAFFNSIRLLFGGRLTQGQVSGMEEIVAAWNVWRPGAEDLRPMTEWLAYALATTFHETARSMQPIAEIGRGAGKIYGRADPVTGQVYYGRGYVQLTWRANYEVQGERLGLNLVGDPGLALKPMIAADIMLNGMAHGQFTGRRLGQYFRPGRSDPAGARAIINGQDRADLIAGYHTRFLGALKAAPSII